MKLTADQKNELNALYDGLWDLRNKTVDFNYELKLQASHSSRASEAFRKLHLVRLALSNATPGSVSTEQLQELGPNLPFQLVSGFTRKQRNIAENANLVAILGPDLSTVGPFETVVIDSTGKPALATLRTSEPNMLGYVAKREESHYSSLFKAMDL